jgi:hypothetical protein
MAPGKGSVSLEEKPSRPIRDLRPLTVWSGCRLARTAAGFPQGAGCSAETIRFAEQGPRRGKRRLGRQRRLRPRNRPMPRGWPTRQRQPTAIPWPDPEMNRRPRRKAQRRPQRARPRTKLVPGRATAPSRTNERGLFWSTWRVSHWPFRADRLAEEGAPVSSQHVHGHPLRRRRAAIVAANCSPSYAWTCARRRRPPSRECGCISPDPPCKIPPFQTGSTEASNLSPGRAYVRPR